MFSVRGIFEDGEVRLLEDVALEGTHSVIVTFLDDSSDNEMPGNTEQLLRQQSGFWQEYLSDEREDLYQE